MNGIGWAVKQMQSGHRVCRPGWNGKGMWLALCTSNWNGEIVGHHDLPADWEGHLPFVVIYTADKKFLPWNCSQADLLATDWEIAD